MMLTGHASAAWPELCLKHHTATDGIALWGTWGQKRVSRNSATPASGHLWAPQGSRHEVLRGTHTTHRLSPPLSPHQVTVGTEDQVTSASGRPWLRNGTGPGGGRVWAVRDSLWGSCPHSSPCSVFLGQRNPLTSLPAWPYSTSWPREHQESGCLVRAPPCGYCPDDCHMCYETETGVLGGRRGKGPPRAPTPVPELAPQPLWAKHPPSQSLCHL